MVPYWQKAASSHPGMGEDTGETRKAIQFGRIYGSGFTDVSILMVLVFEDCKTDDILCSIRGSKRPSVSLSATAPSTLGRTQQRVAMVADGRKVHTSSQ